ncbi:MAG: hypothetical protein PVSMB7_16390 [Chloroflexota bacterium]
MPHFSHLMRTPLLSLLCLVPLLCVCVLSGCGSTGHASSTVLTIWYGTDDPVERAWSQHLTSRFEAAHPHRQVRLTNFSFSDLNTKLQLALSSGTPPDLVYTTPRGPGIPAYVRAHLLLDLTPDARANRWATSLRPGLLAQYNQPFSFYGARHGAVMAVPTALAAVGVLYNRPLLAHLGLTVPTAPDSFEHALAVAHAAGVTPIGMGNADGWLGDDWYLTLVDSMLPATALAGELVRDPRFSFHRSAFLQAGRILQRWSQAGYFTRDFGGLDAQEGIDEFFRGRTLFQLVSSSENPQIMQDQKETKRQIGVFAFPSRHGGTVMPVSGYEGWAIPAASRHHRVAVTFINFLLSSRTAGFLLNQSVVPAHGVLPAHMYIPPWQQDYVRALASARPGVYIDAAPVANLNATMEANVQLLLQGYEPPSFLVKSLQQVYSSGGLHGSTARIDGEF